MRPRDGSVAIVERLRLGENASLHCNLSLAYPRANTSSFEEFVPIFTCQVLGIIGQTTTIIIIVVIIFIISCYSHKI